MSLPAPLVLEPSGVWLGNNGNWSTWTVEIGTPPQQFYIVPSTSHGEIWVPDPQGCSDVECAASRGVISSRDAEILGYQHNVSSTWEQIGIYELLTGGDLFNTTETGLYGLDAVSVDNGTLSIPDQTVASIATWDFWLGSLGLTQQSSDFPTLNESVPSFLDAMKADNFTPSASFGYAVGASYKTFAGSLIIGGYDQSLMDGPSVNIATAGNQSRPLRAAVHSIVATNTAQGTFSLTNDLPALQVALDSGVSQLWLPPQVCDQLAESLNLTYDSLTQLYLINETARSTLLDLSPEFTFTLAAAAESNETVNIVLPYAAFDLEIGLPFFNESTRYFPIRRAANDTLYVLGRSFLQEAYLVVDWERGNFTVGQVMHERSAASQIVPIPPLGQEKAKSSGLGTAAIAGIAVGAVVAVVLVALLAFFLWRKKRSTPISNDETTLANKADPLSPFPEDKKLEETAELEAKSHLLAEASSTPVHEMQGNPVAHQLMSSPVYELPAEVVGQELDGNSKGGGIAKGG